MADIHDSVASIHEAAEEGCIQKAHIVLAHHLKRGKAELTVLHERENLLGATPLAVAAERGHMPFVKVRGKLLRCDCAARMSAFAG